MVRALLICQLAGVASAAKTAMDVLVWAKYDGDQCQGESTGFEFEPFATLAAAACQRLPSASQRAFYKSGCNEGVWTTQQYSDGACTTEEGEATMDYPNGSCRGQVGRIAGCGSYQCEQVGEDLVCDGTPEKSVYEPPPSKMNVLVQDYYSEARTCSDGEATRMYMPNFAMTEADASCTEQWDDSYENLEGYMKHYCSDGAPVVQEYEDTDCATKKGSVRDVTGECDYWSMKSKNIACGTYTCSMLTPRISCEPPTTSRDGANGSNGSSSGSEMLSGLHLAAALGMAAVLGA